MKELSRAWMAWLSAALGLVSVAGITPPAGAAPSAVGPFTAGTVVSLGGTPHLWFVDAQGLLHWGGDSRALAGHTINWNSRADVTLEQLKSLPVGDPWLSASLLKMGDPIYLAKWETSEVAPTLLRIQSIADVEIFGINGTNYGAMVLDQASWEQRAGRTVTGLATGTLDPAIPVSGGDAPTRMDWCNLHGANLSGTERRFVDLHGCDLSLANLKQTDLYHANLSAANLTGANATQAVLTGADLTRAKLRQAILTKADLREANLCGADLYQANLAGADLTGANVCGADFTRAILTGAVGRGLDLSGVVLTGTVTLNTADLRQANLSGLNLAGVNLSGANLSGANLSGANLTAAKLQGTVLAGANLSRANLTGATATRAIWTGADLSGATTTGCTGCP